MKTAHRTPADTARSATAVRGMLRDIGYVLWLSRMVAAEIEAGKSQPVRPEVCDFCAVGAAGTAAWGGGGLRSARATGHRLMPDRRRCGGAPPRSAARRSGSVR